MKKLIPVVIAMLFLSQAWAEEIPSPVPEGTKGATFLQEPAPKKGLFSRYINYMDQEIQRIDEMDLWGPGSTQLPEGYFSVKYQYNNRMAQHRYDTFGHKIPIIPHIEFKVDNDNYLLLDLGGDGSGGSHSFLLSYDLIGGYLDYYIELPFIYMDVTMKPKYLNKCNDLTKCPGLIFGLPPSPDWRPMPESFWEELARLGRPKADLHYSCDWEWQDINTGFSFNYYKSDWMSTSVTPKVFFPTGKIANPDRSIDFLLGPELDKGTGGYSVALVSDYDFRLPWFKRLMFTGEFSIGYAFRHRRPTPHFLKPDPEKIKELQDLGVWYDIAPYFPDLSNIGDHYYSTPGASYDASFATSFDFTVAALNIGYGYSFKSRPTIESSSPEFTQFIYGLEIVGQSETRVLSFALITPALFALYIPATVQFRYDVPVGGSNALMFENNFFITIQTFVPINPAPPKPEKVAAL